jgi:predicted ATPase
VSDGGAHAPCGLDRVAPLSAGELSTWLAMYPYVPKVFLLPLWQEIYTNNAERDPTFQHAEWVNRITLAWYRRLDRYQLIEVPKVSVVERCTFVLQALAISDT